MMNAEQKQAARNLIDDFKGAENEWDEAAAASHMAALLQELVDAPSVPDGHVHVQVSGLTGSGKSAVAGEIEIAMRAIGLDVEWVDSEGEKRLTHADYVSALELYKPKVRIFEKNIPRATPVPAGATCNCTFAQRMQGDGCAVCNPERAADFSNEPPADVARDAERYRWLRDNCRATGEHWGGRWSLVIEGPCPDGDKSSGAIDKAIDAAIKRQGGES